MNLIKSTGTFGFYTIISRILGYLRDILIAVFLGTSFIADAFFVAFRIPNTFRRLFAEGTFNAAFVPSYTSELTKGKTKSKKFADQIFNLLFLGLFFLVLIIEIFMPIFVSLIAPGFVVDAEKLELSISLTRITFPFLMFVCLASFFGAILNSHNKFAAASAAPIILNLILIGILFFGKLLDDQIVYYLSYGVSIAGFLQIIFLYKFVNKFYIIKLNFNFKISKPVKIFFKKLLPSIFSSGVTQINILVGTIIASFQASAVSYLYYADRIYQINLAIAGIAIGVVVLPQLSKYVQMKKKREIYFIQNKALELSMFLSIPATIALIIGSNEIVSALFGYGSFEYIRKSVLAFNLPSVELPNYEADDLIATYVDQILKKGAKVTIVSSDKDLMQLYKKDVRIFDPMKNKFITDEDVQKKFGVEPSKVIDVQALAGDSSDNVPGVPGIGIKTAAELINKYGTLDKLLKSAHEIKQNKRRGNCLTL